MNLPEDIMVEILSKLQVKSLIRFECVSTLWYSIINNQNFISKHINNQNKKKDNASLLISHRNNVTNKRVVSLIPDYHKIDTFHDQDLPPIFHDMFGHVRLVGPCHGLVCLYGFPDNIAIWNPSTREFKALPRSPIPRPPDAKVRGGDLGLGFDSNMNDYKVIQILFCLSSQQHGFAYQMEIYSLLTNSWKKYDSTFPANIMYVNIWSMVYKNETFCWWAKDGNIEVILSFDMSKEVFKNTPLPLDIEMLGGQHRIIRAILPLHDESIALVVYRLKEVEKCFDIWVMNGLEDNKDHQSWRKLSTIGPLSRVERPLGFSKKGEFILESSSRELVFYDPRKQEIKNLGMYGKRDRLEVLNYKESLVSVNRCKLR